MAQVIPLGRGAAGPLPPTGCGVTPSRSPQPPATQHLDESNASVDPFGGAVVAVVSGDIEAVGVHEAHLRSEAVR